MKIKVAIWIIICLAFGFITGLPQTACAQDSTGTSFGKYGRVQVELVKYTFIMKAAEMQTEESNAKVKSFPLLTVGTQIALVNMKYDIGIAGGIMFSTENEVFNTIPNIGLRYKFLTGGIGYMLGHIDGNYENDLDPRGCVLMGINPLELIDALK